MKCPNCGADSVERSTAGYSCSYCRSRFSPSEVGEPLPVQPQQTTVIREIRYVHDSDRLGFGLGCLCWFVFPLAWVVWAVSRRNSPNRARTAFIVAIIQTAFLFAGILAAVVSPDSPSEGMHSSTGPALVDPAFSAIEAGFCRVGRTTPVAALT